MSTNTKWILGVALVFGLIAVFIAGGVVGALAYKAFAPADESAAAIEVPRLGRFVAEQEEEGVVIIEVLSDSPAENSGLEVGDVIVKVNGEEIGEDGDLAEWIAEYEPGESVELTILRAGEEDPVEVNVELGDHPDDEGQAYLGVVYAPSRQTQLRFMIPRDRDLSGIPMPHMDELLKDYESHMEDFQFLDGCDQIGQEGSEDGTCGLIVAVVAEASPAEEAGILVGDLILTLNGETFGSQEEFVEEVRSFEPGDEITLTIYRMETGDTIEVTAVLAGHPDDPEMAYLGVSVPGFFHQIVPPMFQPNQEGSQFNFRFPWMAPESQSTPSNSL